MVYLFLMKFFSNIIDNINKWLDEKLKEVKEQEMEFKVFEIQYDEIRNPKPDWGNVYKNIPVSHEEMIKFDKNKKTGALKPPTPPTKSL